MILKKRKKIHNTITFYRKPFFIFFFPLFFLVHSFSCLYFHIIFNYFPFDFFSSTCFYYLTHFITFLLHILSPLLQILLSSVFISSFLFHFSFLPHPYNEREFAKVIIDNMRPVHDSSHSCARRTRSWVHDGALNEFHLAASLLLLRECCM